MKFPIEKLVMLLASEVSVEMVVWGSAGRSRRPFLFVGRGVDMLRVGSLGFRGFVGELGLWIGCGG